MADFKLKADIILSKVQISQAVRNQLKNIKINIQAPNLSQINKTLQNINANSNKLANSINTANNNVKKLNNSAASTNKNMRDMSDFFAEIGRKALAFRVAASAINSFTNSIIDAANFLRELDQILAEVKKISNLTDNQLANLGTSLIEIASKYGQAAEEVADKYKEILQAGFDAEKSLKVVELATQGAAATTLDFAQATDLVIQSYKVFGDQEAEKIFDKIAVAEAAASVTALDLQEAIKRSAGTFIEMNTSVDEMIGLVSALQEVSQRGGAVIGTAFKTIGPRIFAGETRDAVEELGVTVAEQDGKLRPFIDVLSDIQVKFRGLTEEQRIYYAKTIAGVRQIESFLQILRSLDQAQVLTAMSTNSNGEAQKRAAIQAETLNGKLNTLRNTFLQTVRNVQDFAPLVEIFKSLTVALTEFLKAGDGAVAKMTALAGLLVGFRAMVPIFKGMGKLLGGGQGFLGGGASIAALGGIGKSILPQQNPMSYYYKGNTLSYDAMRQNQKGQNVRTAYGGGFANVAAGPQKSLAYQAGQATGKAGQAFNAFIKDSNKMSIAALAAGVALAGLSSNMEGALKESTEKLGLALTSFSFGPIIGFITSMSTSLPTIANAMDNYIDRQKAFGASMGKFGSESLAQMSADLVEAQNNGDDYAASVIQQDIAFRQAIIGLQKGESNDKLRAVGSSIEGFLKQAEELAPGVEMTMGELGDKLVAAATKAGYSADVAAKLIYNPKAFKEVIGQISLYTHEFKGATFTTIDEMLAAINELRSSFKAESLMPDLSSILSSKDVIGSQRDLIESFRQAALAEEIFNKGITDSIEIRKKQTVLEYEFAKGNVERQQQLFTSALSDFVNIGDFEGKLDFGSVFDIFKKEAQKGAGIPSLNNIVGELEKVIGEAGVGSDDLKERLGGVVEAFIESEKAFPEFAKKARQFYDDMTSLDFQQLEREIDRINEARNREIDHAEKLANVLSGTRFMDQGNIGAEFDDLNTLLSKEIDSDALYEFFDIIENSSPIVEAEKAILDYMSSTEDEINMANERNRVLRESLTQFQNLIPSEERNNKIKEIENKILENNNDIELIRAKALKETGEKTKLLAAEEKKAYEATLKAQMELSDSLYELVQTIQDNSLQEYEEAHESLGKAQESIIKSTEDLADAYEDLKEAQFALGDAVADYRIGVNLAAREADVITGRIKGFTEQLRSVQDVYDEVLKTTMITEVQRLELIKESASKQLEIVQSVIEETKSIGQRLFTAESSEGGSIVRGFAAIRDIMNQFQGMGGFENVDLNEFGNQLLQLPQSMREEIANALSYLPETATLGGFSKKEIEDVLFGSAVGESQEANIQNINELTGIQVELLNRIAEYNSAGIIAANAQLEESRKQYAAAEAQLQLDEIMLAREEENFSDVTQEIHAASALISSIQMDTTNLLANTFNDSLFSANKENLASRASEHLDRLSVLRNIDINTKSFADALKGFSSNVITGYSGHIPNFARGNIGEFGALIQAYNREKKMSPPGSKPVIANSSEYIIPTKAKGNIPNFQTGNVNLDLSTVEETLIKILERIQNNNESANRVLPNQVIEANINVNGEQKIQLTGASTIAESVAKALKAQLGDFVTNDQMTIVNDQILEFFDVLRKRGLVNIFGQG